MKVTHLLVTAVMASAAPVQRNQARDGGPGGLAALTEPLAIGAVQPLTAGLGSGLAEAAGGTQQAANPLDDAVGKMLHVLGGVAANTEKAAGVAVGNTSPEVQGTIKAIEHNPGVLGDVASIVGG